MGSRTRDKKGESGVVNPWPEGAIIAWLQQALVIAAMKRINERITGRT